MKSALVRIYNDGPGEAIVKLKGQTRMIPAGGSMQVVVSEAIEFGLQRDLTERELLQHGIQRQEKLPYAES